MAKINLSKLTLDELKGLQNDVAKAVKTFETRKKKEALAALEAQAREMGFNLGQLTGNSKKPKSSGAPKYSKPGDPSMTWTGRGRKPQWFADALDSGTSEAEMLIA